MPDIDSIMSFAWRQVGAKQLCCLARSSKALYVFSHMDELWKALVIARVGGAFCFKGTWRDTYKTLCREPCDAISPHVPIKVKGFYSDVLFQPWLCSSLQIPDVSQSGSTSDSARAPEPVGLNCTLG